jgi:trans-aconitate methyltransferase
VDSINDQRLKGAAQYSELPGLYHPRQGTQPAWLEIAVGKLLPSHKPLHKRLVPRLSFKGNLAAVVFSLVGQHYYMTLRHSVKRGQLESSIRAYTEKQLRKWQESQNTLRSRLFKPVQPVLERWGRALQKRVAQEQKKKQAKGAS